MRQRRNRPGDRIGQIQRKQRPTPLKYGKDPHNPETAGSDEGNDHGEEGVAHSSHASHHDIHEAAEEIGGADEMHSVEAVLDDLRVGGVNAEKLLAEEQAKAEEEARKNQSKAEEEIKNNNGGNSGGGSHSSNNGGGNSGGGSHSGGNSGGGNHSGGSNSGGGISSSARSTIVSTAYSLLGKAYVWGASGPNAYDCSGLVQACYGAAGIYVPHSSGALSAYCNKPASQAVAGDIVWRSGHVGICIGGGQTIEAMSPGQGVTYGSIYTFTSAGSPA